MKASIKVRWERRLREMDPTLQDIGSVRYGNKRCALGVLYDIAVEDGILTIKDPSTTYFFDPVTKESIGTVLNKRLCDWLGINFYNNKTLRIGDTVVWRLNDRHKLTFKDFAKLLHKTKASDIT